jgi:hypothetical protein
MGFLTHNTNVPDGYSGIYMCELVMGIIEEFFGFCYEVVLAFVEQILL